MAGTIPGGRARCKLTVRQASDRKKKNRKQMTNKPEVVPEKVPNGV